jgi:hypothetical protein
MYKIEMKNYKCSQCNTKCPTKTIFDHHTSVCKFIHTSCIENSIERYYREIDIPTHEAMVHYIFNRRESNKITEISNFNTP